MRTLWNLKKLTTKLLVFAFILTVSSALIAQENKSSDLKDFKVIVEKTEKGLEIQGIQGTAWTDLSFRINNNRPQAIDEYGMTKLDKKSSVNDPSLTDLLFTITKTEGGIVLKGIKGTAWTDLSFALRKNEKQTINQFGMSKPD